MHPAQRPRHWLANLARWPLSETSRWPGQCALCRVWSTDRVCPSCIQRWAPSQPRCRTCALPLPQPVGRNPAGPAQCGACLREPPPLDQVIAAVDYAFPWDGLLQRFKFQQAVELRAALLDRLGAALDAARVESPDWLLPVPLSAARLRERGYNQAWELACGLARRRGLHAEAGLLLRPSERPRQSDLRLAERAANVRGVFALEPGRLGALRGAHVALLDDVMTSGATLTELARLLRRAGASRVQAWVVARTPAPESV